MTHPLQGRYDADQVTRITQLSEWLYQKAGLRFDEANHVAQALMDVRNEGNRLLGSNEDMTAKDHENFNRGAAAEALFRNVSKGN